MTVRDRKNDSNDEMCFYTETGILDENITPKSHELSNDIIADLLEKSTEVLGSAIELQVCMTKVINRLRSGCTPTWIRTTDAAIMISRLTGTPCSPEHIRYLARKGELVSRKEGKLMFVLLDEVQEKLVLHG